MKGKLGFLLFLIGGGGIDSQGNGWIAAVILFVLGLLLIAMEEKGNRDESI